MTTVIHTFSGHYRCFGFSLYFSSFSKISVTKYDFEIRKKNAINCFLIKRIKNGVKLIRLME